jgi:hypothetical protein
MHALSELLGLSNGINGKITKCFTMIHTSREGLDYYFVEVTGTNGCRYLIQAYGQEAQGLQKETKSQVSRY